MNLQEESSSQKSFIADGMLGKLSRWLRLLGYDVLYFHDIADDELLRKAKESNRVLLTKDFTLYRRAVINDVEAIMLRGKCLEEDLALLAALNLIKLEFNRELTRCPLCNCKLKIIKNKDEIKNIIPPNILEKYDFFWVCNGCGKVYWLGSHWNSINKSLLKAKSLIKKFE
ncbi:MAG: Mut7-C RNAse domain-containing protein [archaeon GB-1867-035]|nr:Mut7-C RNAse domain-containing protein [Candidatus Culexmicrobium profundum]